MEKHFQENILFETHSRKKICHMWRFWKISSFFRRNQSVFPEKPQNLNVLRFFAIPVAFYGQFATFSQQNNLTFRHERTTFLAWTQLVMIGKKPTFMRGRFCFHFLNKAQNNKTINTHDKKNVYWVYNFYHLRTVHNWARIVRCEKLRLSKYAFRVD